MGSSSSIDSAPKQKEINNEINKEIIKQKYLQSKTVKILLLGGPESGKTTIFKQMKILHQNGFSKMDLINFKYLVHSNVIKSMIQLLDGLKILNVPLDPEIKEDVETFRFFCGKGSSDGREQFDLDLDTELAQRIERIWKSHCIQAVFRKRFSIPLLQSAERYLNDIHRLADANYAPDVEDILICRKITIGVQEIFFSYKDLTFNMVDVGGQKSERRKWIHCFDDVKLILFIAAMSDYDVISQETDTSLELPPGES